MKVAIFTETFLPQVNGVVRTIERIVRHLEDNGHEVLVITIGEGDASYSNSPVVRVEGIKFSFYKELYLVKPEDKWFAKILKQDLMHVPLSILQALVPNKHSLVEKTLAEFQPDIVHLATPATLGAIGLYYVEHMQLPCLATFHTDLAAYAPMYQVPYIEEILNTVTKMVYSKAGRVLAPSPSSQKKLEEIGLTSVGVFGRGVDADLFNPNKRNKKIWSNYGLNPDAVTLLYVGRLADEKSIPELIEAFLSLEKKGANIQLVIVGDGPIKDELEARLKHKTKNYVFTGIKKGEELAELYASADIFAFPSRTETFGQVVLEAMASGVPVVGYDSPGVRDLVQHNETGLLAGINGLEFSKALESLINNEKQRLSFGTKSRELSLERAWGYILDSLVTEYEELIGVKISQYEDYAKRTKRDSITR